MRRVLAWTAGAAAVLAVVLGVLYAVAARQPRVEVTTEEVIPPGEMDATMRLVRMATAAIEEQSGPDHLYKRDAHAKPHGCLIGVLDVRDDLAPEHRQGIFRKAGRRYKTWVRFSNGTAADDTAADARGMAIKVMGVGGQKVLDRRDDPERKTQDFVMVNYHTFFLRTLEEYESFFGYQAKNKPIAYFFAGGPLHWRLHELYHGGHMLFQRVPNPLSTRYYSMSAYRFGPRNVKFSAQPCVTPRDVMPPKPRGSHYLRDALVRSLRSGDACFDFKVQLQDPTKNMPIEDPTIQWDERESPYVTVATLRIPRQEFSTDAQNRFCENLQFAPWHTLPEHRPLGSLNRARKIVYREVSRRRHYRNATLRGEPHGWCLALGRACAPADEPRLLLQARK